MQLNEFKLSNEQISQTLRVSSIIVEKYANINTTQRILKDNNISY